MGDVMIPTAEDIAAMREDGSFEEFLKHLTASQHTPASAAAPEPVVEREPGHRPGAWPTGTRRPTPPVPVPAEAWQQAVHAYRHWLAAGSPPGDFTCHCGACPAANAERRAA